MSIEGVYNSLNSMMSVRKQSGTVAETATNSAKLAKLTDSISLSSISPGLRSVLENISEQGGNVLDALESNVGNLQEGLLETLQSKFNEGGVNLDEKITLKLNDAEQLSMVGEHPSEAEITSILEQHPEIEDAFKEIATQSQLMRDIRSIRNVVSNKTGTAQYQGMAASGQNSAESYSVSMRGAMSHFYFSTNK